MHTTSSSPILAGLISVALVAGTSACADDTTQANTEPDSTVATAAPPVASAPTTSTTPDTTPPTTVVEPIDTIPDGRYERVITAHDAERLGVDPAVAAEALGDPAHVAFEIEGDRWRVLVGTNPDRMEIGDEGSSVYDDQRNWITTSESIGCPGCTATIAWSFEGDSLVFSAPNIADPIARIVTDGTFNRVGSGGADPITLTGFLDFVPPQVVGFLDAVDASDEPIRVTTDLTLGYQRPEAELIKAVAAGEIDMAFVGARAFPRFDPLLAPFLVDSYDLQQAVFEQGLPKTMLAELGVKGVVGLGVMPGPFRKIMGVDRTVDQASDLVGARVNTDDTPLAQSTFAAIGATPVPGGAIDEVNAFAIQLQAIPGNGYEDDAIAVTANLNMWPRPLVIIMNADVFAALTPDQQDALREATVAATNAAISASQAEDEEALRSICPSPMQIIQMSEQELRALEVLVEPVYADLRQDAIAAAELETIQALKKSIGAPPDTFTCE